MLDNKEERRVKERHDVTQFYQRRSVKRTMSRQDLPRGDMTISGDPDSNANSSSDNDIEDDTYIPSPRACTHRKDLASASGSGSGAARDDEEIEEEAEGDGEGEIFDVEEINSPNYVDIEPFVFRVPSNCTWRMKVSYKGKTESVRENSKIHARTRPREAYDYKFHLPFQLDIHELVVIPKSKPVANSQRIDWPYMESKSIPSLIESLQLVRPNT
jgi:hypothetical protein